MYLEMLGHKDGFFLQNKDLAITCYSIQHMYNSHIGDFYLAFTQNLPNSPTF